MTKLSIDDARNLAMAVLRLHRLSDEYATMVIDHLIDAQLTGYTFAGLPRLLVVLDRLRSQLESPPEPVAVVNETPVSATVAGNGNLGYVVCSIAVDKAIEKAAQSGVGMVGAHDSYYSGRSGYYAERAARSGFVAIHASSAFPMVAPTGGRRPLLGSNPITMAFPTSGDPIVVDLSTAASTWGALQLAQRVGEQLPEGVAIDADGEATIDPAAALMGAILPAAGHKGYALGTAVQALGVLAGGDAVPESFGNFGFFFTVVRRDLFVPSEQYDQRIDAMVEAIRSSPTLGGAGSVKLPGEGSSQRRRVALSQGTIEIPEQVHRALLDLTEQGPL